MFFWHIIIILVHPLVVENCRAKLRLGFPQGFFLASLCLMGLHAVGLCCGWVRESRWSRTYWNDAALLSAVYDFSSYSVGIEVFVLMSFLLKCGETEGGKVSVFTLVVLLVQCWNRWTTSGESHKDATTGREWTSRSSIHITLLDLPTFHSCLLTHCLRNKVSNFLLQWSSSSVCLAASWYICISCLSSLVQLACPMIRTEEEERMGYVRMYVFTRGGRR